LCARHGLITSLSAPQCTSEEIDSCGISLACRYPRDAIGTNCPWYCRKCTFDTTLPAKDNKLNRPQDQNCRTCDTPRRGVLGPENNSFELLVCQRGKCGYINRVDEIICRRRYCPQNLPVHPLCPKNCWKSPQPRVFFLSKNNESEWFCTKCCRFMSTWSEKCGVLAIKHGGEIVMCPGEKSKTGVWVAKSFVLKQWT
jgi:hypothetical protein